MSSPIHKFLFSPPPSPPHRAVDSGSDATSAHGLTSIKSLILPIDLINRGSMDGSNELKPRSPRTPTQRHFFASAQNSPSIYSRPKVVVEDVEATPRMSAVYTYSEPATPRVADEKRDASLPINVPSSSLPIPSSLPKPLLRLLFLVSLVLSSIVLLVYVPSARLPSLRAASTSRRLALAPDGRAYYDVSNGVASWDEAKDRDYAPPQVRVPSMMKRTAMPAPAAERVPQPHPKATRPSLAHRPLPQSHEMLAVQAYLLQSSYNVLPLTGLPSEPVNAHAVMSFAAHKLGAVGSEQEKAWLAELEQEHQDDIVVWYGGNGDDKPPHALLDVLAALHGPKRKPRLIPCKHRNDLAFLHGVLERQSLDIKHHPLIMIGNTPISGDLEGLEELRGSGRLREMLAKIGWLKEEPSKKVRPVKVAKLKKRVLSEIEHALKQA